MMDQHHIIIGIVILAAGTYLLRLLGLTLASRITFSDATRTLLADAATTLLLAVAAIATLFEGQQYAGSARLIGVIVGGLLAWKKCPLVLVLLAAAASTALLRQLGIN